TFSLEEDHKDPEYLPKLDSKQQLLQLWKKSQKQLDGFWRYWSDEYLTSLRERFQTEHKSPRIKHATEPKEGDLVLMKQENLPRGSWKLGRIQKLIEGADGKVRSAEVLQPSKKLLTRPINLLYPTEVAVEKPSVPVQSTPAFILRNSKHSSVTTSSIFLVTVCLLLVNSSLCSTKECNMNTTSSLTSVYSSKCIKRGIGVFKTKEGTFCWKSLRCATGHLDGKGKGVTFCPCPKWAATVCVLIQRERYQK
ncbi:MAG: hypothetical protein GY816_01560, partial [Cytophagales bacterium]|nr:hypothetical protein [Cytophagales bacterium]